jgi:hypothetical protein
VLGAVCSLRLLPLIYLPDLPHHFCCQPAVLPRFRCTVVRWLFVLRLVVCCRSASLRLPFVAFSPGAVVWSRDSALFWNYRFRYRAAAVAVIRVLAGFVLRCIRFTVVSCILLLYRLFLISLFSPLVSSPFYTCLLFVRSFSFHTLVPFVLPFDSIVPLLEIAVTTLPVALQISFVLPDYRSFLPAVLPRSCVLSALYRCVGALLPPYLRYNSVLFSLLYMLPGTCSWVVHTNVLFSAICLPYLLPFFTCGGVYI